MQQKIRLTAGNIKKILEKNEGFTETRKYYSHSGSSHTNVYHIHEGKLFVHRSGKGSFGDVHYEDPPIECDSERTKVFLRSVIGKLSDFD